MPMMQKAAPEASADGDMDMADAGADAAVAPRSSVEEVARKAAAKREQEDGKGGAAGTGLGERGAQVCT